MLLLHLACREIQISKLEADKENHLYLKEYQ